MATKSMAYDQPTYTVRRMATIALPATAASTSVRKFVAFTDIKVKSIGGILGVAGTSTGATVWGWQVNKGVTSISAWSLATATATALMLLPAITSDLTLASGDYIDFKTLSLSATNTADLYIEYELIPQGVVTV